MTTAERLAMLKSLLKITDTAQDSELSVYLAFCKTEIIAWLYSGAPPDGMTDIPARYEPTLIAACVAGYGLSGVEGESTHVENGISRQFKYPDMIDYIHSHVAAYAQVI